MGLAELIKKTQDEPTGREDSPCQNLRELRSPCQPTGELVLLLFVDVKKAFYSLTPYLSSFLRD